jgi:hypothetical protein
MMDTSLYEAREREQKKLENGSFSKHPSLLSHRNPKRQKRERKEGDIYKRY